MGDIITIFNGKYLQVPIPKTNMLVYNSTTVLGPFINGTYTGLSGSTFKENLFCKCTL